jgi:trimeric autotransporter adhesin
MMKFYTLVIALAAVLQATPSDTCNQNTWVTNGPVYAIAPAGNKVYIGGSFSRVGPYTGGGFDSIHSVVRNNIAALDATTGNALAWNPDANYGIYSLAVSGTTVYAGGDFTSIGGQSRNRIAALDATTGNVTSWDPNANGIVQSLFVSGTTVYAGGVFYIIGGQSRSCIAALDATTGKATSWNPNAYGPPQGPGLPYFIYVSSLAVSGATVYAGGEFTTIGGQSRKGIAALDATTGNATAWNPNANYGIFSLVVSGATVYAGGYFDTIGGQSRRYLAALDAATGNAMAWNPNPNSYYVYSLAVSGTTVYAGGYFDSIGGQNRMGIAALDATTGNALAWNPNANNFNLVNTVAVNGTTVYAGGRFTSIGQGIGHPYFAQFDSSYQSPVVQPISASSSSKNARLQIISTNFRSGAFVKFAYSLSKAEHVSLRVYNINGQLLSVLVNNLQEAGNHSFNMQKGILAAGLYLIVFKAGEYHQEKMISLMK